jgi:hypothetical protein
VVAFQALPGLVTNQEVRIEGARHLLGRVAESTGDDLAPGEHMPRDLIVARAEDFAALKAETSFAVLLQEVQVVSAVLVFNAVRFSMLLEHLVALKNRFWTSDLAHRFPNPCRGAVRSHNGHLACTCLEMYKLSTPVPQVRVRLDGIGDGDREVVDSFI